MTVAPFSEEAFAGPFVTLDCIFLGHPINKFILAFGSAWWLPLALIVVDVDGKPDW